MTLTRGAHYKPSPGDFFDLYVHGYLQTFRCERWEGRLCVTSSGLHFRWSGLTGFG